MRVPVLDLDAELCFPAYDGTTAPDTLWQIQAEMVAEWSLMETAIRVTLSLEGRYLRTCVPASGQTGHSCSKLFSADLCTKIVREDACKELPTRDWNGNEKLGAFTMDLQSAAQEKLALCAFLRGLWPPHL